MIQITQEMYWTRHLSGSWRHRQNLYHGRLIGENVINYCKIVNKSASEELAGLVPESKYYMSCLRVICRNPFFIFLSRDRSGIGVHVNAIFVSFAVALTKRRPKETSLVHGRINGSSRSNRCIPNIEIIEGADHLESTPGTSRHMVTKIAQLKHILCLWVAVLE